MSFYVDYFPPNNVWPNGGWSLYQISGDKIAQNIVYERINPKGWYEGKVTHRHSWPGFVGCFDTLPKLMEAIETRQKN